MSSAAIYEELTESIAAQITGAATVFTTTNTVQDVTQLVVEYNGQRLKPGVAHDYTVTGTNQITFTFAPEVNSNLDVFIIE